MSSQVELGFPDGNVMPLEEVFAWAENTPGTVSGTSVVKVLKLSSGNIAIETYSPSTINHLQPVDSPAMLPEGTFQQKNNRPVHLCESSIVSCPTRTNLVLNFTSLERLLSRRGLSNKGYKIGRWLQYSVVLQYCVGDFSIVRETSVQYSVRLQWSVGLRCSVELQKGMGLQCSVELVSPFILRNPTTDHRSTQLHKQPTQANHEPSH